jgi:HAD superfamily hydrolase (TIGR01509 family)
MRRGIVTLVVLASLVTGSMSGCGPSVEHADRAPECVGDRCAEGIGASGAGGSTGVTVGGGDTTGGGSPSGPGTSTDGGTTIGAGDGSTTPVTPSSDAGGSSGSPVVPGGGTDGRDVRSVTRSACGNTRATCSIRDPMIRAICFDLMDTVLYDPYREALVAATGVDLKTAARARDPQCWPDFEIGAIGEEEFARRYFKPEHGLRFDLDAFHGARRAGYRFLPGMRELIASLEGKVDRYVASNYPIWIEEVRVSFGLDELFEDVFSSHHLRVRKPAPEFFARMMAAIPHPPSACMFVDDRKDNCTAAESVGMTVHHFTGAEELASALESHGIR